LPYNYQGIEEEIHMNLSILDCTLRDGGYYTNWDFTDSLVDEYINCMNSQPAISHIEIGYRSNPQKSYYGKYYYCPRYVLEHFRKNLPNKKIAIMLNEKDTKSEHLDYILSPCIGNVDLIRLAVAPENLMRALSLADLIKGYGFEVGFNLMYMSKWGKDKNFLQQLSKTNGIVNYLYLVDSYGGITGSEVHDIFQSVKNVSSSVLGFHGHNNMELAFANSMVALDAGCTMIDATVLGMGRGAGNLKTELLLTYLNTKHDVDVSFNSLGALVNNVYGSSEFGLLLEKYGWGSNLAYMVSGANSLPQKEVMEWISTRAYSINNIIEALQNSSGSDQKSNVPKLTVGKNTYQKAIIVGGGPSAVEHAKAVNELVNQNLDTCIIHSSTKHAKYYKDIDVPQYYCLVGNEGYRMEDSFIDLKSLTGKCVLPPSPRRMGTYIPIDMRDKSFELEKVDFTDKYSDSHFAIALQLVLDLGITATYLVGYDGYSDTSELGQKGVQLTKENEYLIDKINSTNNKLKALTPTAYEEIEQISLYQLLE
jgi:4-hydroxy 2-oxovalerate aldolase